MTLASLFVREVNTSSGSVSFFITTKMAYEKAAVLDLRRKKKSTKRVRKQKKIVAKGSIRFISYAKESRSTH